MLSRHSLSSRTYRQGFRGRIGPIRVANYPLTLTQGRTHGGGGARGPAPLAPEITILSGFLPLNYVICIFVVCILIFFCCVGGQRKPAAW